MKNKKIDDVYIGLYIIIELKNCYILWFQITNVTFDFNNFKKMLILIYY